MSEIAEWTGQIHHGDAFEVLGELPTESVHAVVTDPPYGISMMGRDWDNFRRRRNPEDVGRDDVGGRLSATAPASGAETDSLEYQRWCQRWATKVLRVLKPGGHLLAFSGSRTHHRLFSGVEDAGYEIRDTICWHYGGGFPKSLDISKALDKQAGEEGEYGEPKGEREAREIENPSSTWHDGFERPWMDDPEAVERNARQYLPASDLAREFDGFKTALKPATEFVVLARKPLSESTVAENVMEHGTGALNIDATRIGSGERPHRTETGNKPRPAAFGGDGGSKATGTTTTGRYPANLVLDQQATGMLDEQSGGAGGASRFFYTSKASKSERTLDGAIENAHPTVKPVDLMGWLVKLATAEGQVVLDPFAGTGTTCRAAKDTGREFVGIEQQANWADVARARCGLDVEDPSVLRDGVNAGLEAFADGGGES